MAKFLIETSFEIRATFEVEAEDFYNALDKIQGRNALTGYGNNLIGFCPSLSEEGIEVDLHDYDTDPSPTGSLVYPGRHWVWESEDEGEDE